MENDHKIKIKVENEANKDYEDESYEEYSITTYGNDYHCKQEDISEPDITPSPSTASEDNSEQQTQAEGNDNKHCVDNNVSQDKKLSCYIKKAIITHFVNNGWTSKSYSDLCNKFPREKVETYAKTIRKNIEDAQNYVYQECESLCFGNITEWLEAFKAMQVPENNYYEPAIIVNAIANNENLPNPEHIGGVDLKSIYSFICNGLMGLPQTQMDPVSAKFLANEFETLINEANSDVADAQTLVMKQKIERILKQRKGQVPPSLDPLWLTEGTIVHNDIINPECDFKILQNDILVPNETGTTSQNDISEELEDDDSAIAHNGNINLKKEEIMDTGILNPKNEPIH